MEEEWENQEKEEEEKEEEEKKRWRRKLRHAREHTHLRTKFCHHPSTH